MSDAKSFDSFDGLRAIFCIGIVIYHVNGTFNSSFFEWLTPIYSYGGAFGNYAFFIISGFLISHRYKKRIADRKCSFCSFMAKRILSVYPIYFLSNLVMMLICISRSSATVTQTITTFLMVSNGWFSGTLTPNNYPAWFLCVLLLCDIWYFFLCVISRKYPKLNLPLCCGFVVLGMILEKGDWNIPFCYRTCGEGYMNFFLGVILENILIQNGGDVEKEKKMMVVNCAFSFALAVSIHGLNTLPADTRWWISGICACLVCLAVCSKHIAKALSWKLLRIIGKYSRSIYLWHAPVVTIFRWFMRKLQFGNSEVNFLLFFLILFACSGLSYYCIEKPWSRWLNAKTKAQKISEGNYG